MKENYVDREIELSKRELALQLEVEKLTITASMMVADFHRIICKTNGYDHLDEITEDIRTIAMNNALLGELVLADNIYEDYEK